MSFFVTLVDDSYQFTMAGYIAMFLLLIAAFAGAAALAEKGKKQKKSMGARHLAYCAVSVALAMVTSMIKLYSFPFGGSVTLFSMLFICLPGYFFGVGTGILTAAAYGILQLIIEPYIYFPAQVIVDYVLAFGALGLCCGDHRPLRVCSAFRLAVLWRVRLGGLESAGLFPGL